MAPQEALFIIVGSMGSHFFIAQAGLEGIYGMFLLFYEGLCNYVCLTLIVAMSCFLNFSD